MSGLDILSTDGVIEILETSGYGCGYLTGLGKTGIILGLEKILLSGQILFSYKEIYLPIVLLYSFALFLLFVILLWLYSISLPGCAEHCVLSLYTAVTRRIHLPKHRTPQKFTPSISFMGGTTAFLNNFLY